MATHFLQNGLAETGIRMPANAASDSEPVSSHYFETSATLTGKPLAYSSTGTEAASS